MRVLVLALPVLGATAAIAVGLARIQWPSHDFWEARAWLVVFAIVVSGVVPVAQTTISEFGEKRRRKKLERGDNIRSFLVSSLVLAVRNCDAPWDLTGVQAFLVEGWSFRKRQNRVAKVRLATAPESGVRWTEGKGVIGLCWQTRRSQILNLDQPPFSELASVSKTRWHMVPERNRFGLSYDDYQALGNKYGTVIAVPIMSSDEQYIGCVTLDMPPGRRLSEVDKAVEHLATTADLVRRLLGK